jgi:hypothetical protein
VCVAWHGRMNCPVSRFTFVSPLATQVAVSAFAMPSTRPVPAVPALDGVPVGGAAADHAAAVELLPRVELGLPLGHGAGADLSKGRCGEIRHCLFLSAVQLVRGGTGDQVPLTLRIACGKRSVAARKMWLW